MHVNRGLLGWGVFFIALGAVPLAVQAGALEGATARRAWELWPLLLIGAGLGLALRSTPLVSLGNIVVGLTLGLMAGGLVGGGIGTVSPFTLCGVASEAPTSSSGQPITGTLGADATVSLSVDCGSLAVRPRAGSDWIIEWPAEGGSVPAVTQPANGLRVEFGRRHAFDIGDPSSRWDMQFPTDPAASLALAVNAGSATLALGGAHVATVSTSVNAGDAKIGLGGALGTTSVTGSVNAGSLSVTLPEPSGTLTGSFSANAGSVRICTPAGVGLRIKMGDEPFGSNNFASRGLAQSGSTWSNGTWDSATSRIDLEVSANLGSITLDPEDGCG